MFGGKYDEVKFRVRVLTTTRVENIKSRCLQIRFYDFATTTILSLESN